MKNTSKPKNAVERIKSVQAVSKQTRGSNRLSPTHVDHWKQRVFTPKYTRGGQAHEVTTYYCKIQFAGRRETFRLHTANLDQAARTARDIYLDVVRKGWDLALSVHKPKPVKPVANTTVGQFLNAVAQTGLISAFTLNSYRSKLRTIVAAICRVGSGRGKGVRRLPWRAEIDQQPLKVITLEELKSFKRDFLAKRAGDPEQLRHAKVTFDAYIRNMRSMFRPEVLKEVAELGFEVPPMPFQDISLEVRGRSGFAYVSNIQPEALLKAAIDELSVALPEHFKVFLLALLLGLRRAEIDQLRWDMVNWERKHIALVPHEYLNLKTLSSAAEIAVEPGLLEILRRYRDAATGPYVIETNTVSRRAAHYRHYRCESIFESLCRWLRRHGVNRICPLHTLRKECGSLVNEKYGLVAAKNMLRHATIDVTVTYYVRDRRRVSTGLETILVSPTSVPTVPDEHGLNDAVAI